MPGFGSATIRLRGIQSRCTATRGCASALATSRSQASCQVACLVGAPGDAALARDAPVGKERELAAQQRVVVGRQRRRRRRLRCQAHQRGDRVAHQARRRGRGRRSPAASCSACEVELAAEVVEEQKAVARRLPRGRAARAGRRRAIRRGDVDERPHVFLRRRRVHDDRRCRRRCGRRGSSGESWRRSTPAAASRRSTRVARRRRAPSQASKASRARGVGPGDGGSGGEGGVTGDGGGRTSGERGNASWIIDSTNRCRSGRRPAPSRPAARTRSRPRACASARLAQCSPAVASFTLRVASGRRRALAATPLPRSPALRSRSRRRAAPRRRAPPRPQPPAAPAQRRRPRHRAAPRRRAAAAAARRGGARSCRSSCARARCAAGPTSTPSAEGDVEFRRGGMVDPRRPADLRPGRGPRARHRQRASSAATATSSAAPSCSSGQRFEGFFRSADLRFARTGAGGKAERIDFLDDQRAVATDATYRAAPSRRRRRRRPGS